MNQLAELQVFVRAVERGTFAGVAKEMGLTPSAISKMVMRLEGRLGVRLMNRTTRRIALTEEGERYFQRGRHLIEEFLLLEEEIAAASGRPCGLLRVTCGQTFGLRYLGPVLNAFQASYPELRLELCFTDRLVDLHAERVDVAVRTLRAQRDSSLMARKIADTHRVICASPAYLAAYGVPQAPEDLLSHRCILFQGPNNGTSRWPFRRADGLIKHVEVKGAVTVDNSEGVLRLALAGMGIIRMGELVVTEAIRQRQLVPLLVAQHEPERYSTWAVFHPKSQNIARVRVFLDFLIQRFGHAPWRVPLNEKGDS
jgi:DNA-binding transcriptional LysR family regulator